MNKALLAVCVIIVVASASIEVSKPSKNALEDYLSLTMAQRVEVAKDPAKAENIWNWIKCHICTDAMGKFVGFIVDHGCALADTAAAAACEAAGLGPEDPMSDLCVAAFIAGCEIVAKDVINNHIDNNNKLCKAIHMC